MPTTVLRESKIGGLKGTQKEWESPPDRTKHDVAKKIKKVENIRGSSKEKEEQRQRWRQQRQQAMSERSAGRQSNKPQQAICTPGGHIPLLRTLSAGICFRNREMIIRSYSS